MKKLFNSILLLMALVMAGCESIEDTYKDYAGDGPIEYLNKIYDLKATAQWQAIKLSWNLKLDPGRTGIMVKWSNESYSDSTIIDKDASDFTVPLTDNSEYTLNVWAIRQENGVITKKSLGDPVYARPYTKESDEFALFTHVVTKQIKVADKKLFVLFDTWADDLYSFKIGYYEKGSSEQKFKEYTTNDKQAGSDGNMYPSGKPYAVIGENVDFGKPVTVVRKGDFSKLGIEGEFELDPLQLYFDLPNFNTDFAVYLRPQLGVSSGDITFSQLSALSSLDVDYKQSSLEDVLNCPNLKTLYLGRNRYLLPGTENTAKDAFPSAIGKEISLAALKLAHDEMGVEIYQYGLNYFDENPGFFDGWNLEAKLPTLNLLNTDGWDITENPMPSVGEVTGLENLLNADASKIWFPLGAKQLREHVIEVDMKQSQTVTGFKLVQANLSDGNLQLPGIVKVEYWNDASVGWTTATFYDDTTIGTGRGETTLIYFDKDHNPKTFQKYRITVSDNFYSRQWENNVQVSYYRTALACFMPFN